jgi:hypothetical protein
LKEEERSEKCGLEIKEDPSQNIQDWKNIKSDKENCK